MKSILTFLLFALVTVGGCVNSSEQLDLFKTTKDVQPTEPPAIVKAQTNQPFLAVYRDPACADQTTWRIECVERVELDEKLLDRLYIFRSSLVEEKKETENEVG